MWNIALDGNGNPRLPNTDSCPSPGCRALVTIDDDGKGYTLNQECASCLINSLSTRPHYLDMPVNTVYSMAQASKAIIPKDPGGPSGKRIGVSVGGPSGWALRVGAYVTYRASSGKWLRYALVVLNCKSPYFLRVG